MPVLYFVSHFLLALCTGTALYHGMRSLGESRLSPIRALNFKGWFARKAPTSKEALANEPEEWVCGEWLETASTCLVAGLGLMQAFEVATRMLPGCEMKRTFERVQKEIFLGRSISEALHTVSSDTGIDSVRRTLVTFRRSQELGSSLSKVLLELRESLMAELRLRDEEKVARLPVKMLFPLAIFVLPSLLLLIGAPMVADFMRLVGQ